MGTRSRQRRHRSCLGLPLATPLRWPMLPQSRVRAPRETVKLNGSTSSDPDGGQLTYLWEFQGTQIELEQLGLTIENRDQATATFEAPDRIMELEFILTVTDTAGVSDTDDVTIRVVTAPPPRPRPTPTPDIERWGPWTDTGVREEDDTDVPRIIWKNSSDAHPTVTTPRPGG